MVVALLCESVPDLAHCLWPSEDQQQCLLVFPAVCPSAPYTAPPFPCIAGVCIVTDEHVQEFETCIKIFREYIPLSKDAGSILVSERRQISCLMSIRTNHTVTNLLLKNVWIKYTFMVRHHLGGFSCSCWTIFPVRPHSKSQTCPNIL